MQTAPKPPVQSRSTAPDKPNSSSDGSSQLELVSRQRLRTKTSFFADAFFRSLTILAALTLLASVGLILYELVAQSRLSIGKFGFSFLVKSIWDPVEENFGALPLIYGTVVSSL